MPRHRILRIITTLCLIWACTCAATTAFAQRKLAGKSKNKPAATNDDEYEEEDEIEEVKSRYPATAEGDREDNFEDDEPRQPPPRSKKKPPQNKKPKSRPADERDQEQPPEPPFRLTEDEYIALREVLNAWEDRCGKVRTVSAAFTRYHYKQANENGEPTVEDGEVKFIDPDKGMFKVNSEGGEHWVCDGKAIYEVDHLRKTVTVRHIPKELQGKAIAQGPLPFLFGETAERMLHRYFMRIITPQDAQGEQIWIEAIPRFQQDAANYEKVEIILNEKDMLPSAIQLFIPNGLERMVYAFNKVKVNDAVQQLLGGIIKPSIPFGYEKIVIEPPTEGGEEVPPRTSSRQKGDFSKMPSRRR